MEIRFQVQRPPFCQIEADVLASLIQIGPSVGEIRFHDLGAGVLVTVEVFEASMLPVVREVMKSYGPELPPSGSLD